MTAFLALALGTLASEDLTCIAAGLLVQRGQLSVATGVLGCAFGIFVGDLGLWAIGRLFGGVAMRWPWVTRRVDQSRAQGALLWLERHAAGAIVGSRFLPGTRVPLYVGAGVLRLPLLTFSVWASVAVLMWTPTIVLLTASFGSAFTSRLAPVIGLGWASRLAVVVTMLLLLAVARRMASRESRRRTAAMLARGSRWEFWPMWLFYAPVAAWIALLSLRHLRRGGLSVVTAANPGMRDGGTVGESKFEILDRLPREWTIPSRVLKAGDAVDRIAALVDDMAIENWTFPIVLKPDVGERGTGVRLVASLAEAGAYLSVESGAVVVQPYHEGPFEAGVFYSREPGDTCGRIFSITDKHFPIVCGDGVSSLATLIWAHPRYRLQAATFLERHRDAKTRIPERGERVQLAIAGNHAQGTLFRDGRHLWTPALEARIDEIARSFPGFFVGRFDVRYRDVDAFKAGTDLAIVELNGATAESTNIYDPDWSLVAAYRQLFRQWSMVFAIGAANRARGAQTTSWSRLAALVRAHLATRPAFKVSD